MKKYILKLFTLLIGVIAFQSCNSDKIIQQVEAARTSGAILRTKAVVNKTFDFFDTSSQWIVSLEEQDAKDGGLFASINVYAKLNTGGTEAQVKTIQASTFTTGPNGLPVGDVAVSLSEVLSALGLNPGDYTPADQFFVRLEVVLTDGRTFSSGNTSGVVAGGSFFSSPFQYSVQFFCKLTDASLFSGNYVVTDDAWADYSPGDIVPVVPVPGTTSFRFLSTNNPFIANPNTSWIQFDIDPATGDVTGGSNEDFNYGSPSSPFLVPVTISSGSVGTCTGSVDVKLNFAPFGDWHFSMVKQ